MTRIHMIQIRRAVDIQSQAQGSPNVDQIKKRFVSVIRFQRSTQFGNLDKRISLVAGSKIELLFPVFGQT